MPVSHLLLAMSVVIVWGFNFLFVKLGLHELPPLLLCAVRFILASIPAIFFIKPPAAPFKIVASYGLIMFALQFALIFIAMNIGMTPGIASLVMQVQVFFSIFFAAILLREMPSFWQILGAGVAFIGIALVGLHLDKTVSLAGLLLVLAAAASWGVGNMIIKKANQVNMMALVVWGSFIAFFPMTVLSIILDGPTLVMYSLSHITWKGVIAVAYIVCASTWIGYGVWNWLLSRYPVSVVAPFTLLVPIVGIMSSVLILDEPFYRWKLTAGLFVIIGLGINIFGARYIAARERAMTVSS